MSGVPRHTIAGGRIQLKNTTPDRLLNNSHDALRRLADSSSMVVWMTNAASECCYLNQDVARMFDDIRDFAVMDIAHFIHPDDLERLRPVFLGAKANRTQYQFEYRLMRSDGSVRWMTAIGAPRFSPSREFLGYVGTISDITNHHDALQKLQKSEAELRLITENTGDLITHSDSAGLVLYVSPSCTSITGYTPEELHGTSVYAKVHPDDILAMQEKIHAQANHRVPEGLVEMRLRCKNGDYIWLEARASVLTDPLTLEKIGTVSIARDITAIKRTQDELRRREERFRGLTNLSSDWYWETDADDRFTFRSEGSNVDESVRVASCMGVRRMETAINQDDPQVLDYLDKVAKRQPFRDIEYESNWGVVGVRRVDRISGEPVFDGEVFKGYRGVGRDATQERLAEAELARLAAENRLLVENTLDIMAMLDPEGRFLRVNRAAIDVLGYTPEEMVGRKYTEFLHPDQIQKTLAVQPVLRTGDDNTLKNFETNWVRKDGKVVQLSLGVRWSEEQQAMFATARDVTHSNRIQAELQKSKDFLSSVLESLGDAFFTLDRDWRVLYLNQKTAKFINGEPQALIGQVLWDIVPNIVGTELESQYRRAMDTGEAALFETFYAQSQVWLEVRVYPNQEGLSVFFHDVTERRAAEVAVRESERKFREVIEMTPAGYLIADGAGVLMDVNPALCEMTGYSESELVGQSVERLFDDCPWEPALDTKSGIAVQAVESILKHRNGAQVYVLVNANVQHGDDGSVAALTAFVTDITERKRAADRLEQLATHDTLTGLPNRALLNDHLQAMVENAAPDSALAVLFIDLDRFKAVNDTLGHEKGDQLLRQVSQRLQRTLRPGDIVARLGGDEFVVAAKCAQGGHAAERIAEKILSMLVAPFDLSGQEVYVGASIGISLFPEDGETKELLFQNADTAMYEAKAAGRNGFRFFKAEMSVEAKHRVTLESALRHALDRNEFEMYYQPRINLATGHVGGAEALIRWNHPQLGRVPPLQFIPIAEETGFIEDIGRWVLEQTCRQTKELIDRTGRDLRVSVNLSARQLKCSDLLEQVVVALARSGLPPALLELELTESALIDDMDMSAGVLKSLKALGISLAVDDFGTGYSGLSYLRKFPIDILKLDRSFVTQEDEGISNSRFIGAFVDMAHALNLSVVAEGVETAEILQLLQDAKCDEAQGYYFAKPMPYADLEKYLKTTNPGR